MSKENKNVKQVVFDMFTTKETFYIDYLNVINGSVGLSNKEIIVLASLIEQYNIIRKKTSNEDIVNELLFSSRHRIIARERADISDLNFNNYISALKKKDVILEDENKFRKINPKIVPLFDLNEDNTLKLVFNINIEEDVQQFRTDVGGEEEREGFSNDEISPFGFSEITGEEASDTEEHFTILKEPQDATELHDGDSSGEGDV